MFVVPQIGVVKDESWDRGGKRHFLPVQFGVEMLVARWDFRRRDRLQITIRKSSYRQRLAVELFEPTILIG
jgi:hypothetical protein